MGSREPRWPLSEIITNFQLNKLDKLTTLIVLTSTQIITAFLTNLIVHLQTTYIFNWPYKDNSAVHRILSPPCSSYRSWSGFPRYCTNEFTSAGNNLLDNCQWPLSASVVLIGQQNQTPTLTFSSGLLHFGRSIGVGRYSLVHLRQKTLDKYCACLHREKSSFPNTPGGRLGVGCKCNRWLEVNGSRGGGYLGQVLLGMCRWPLGTPTPL